MIPRPNFPREEKMIEDSDKKKYITGQFYRNHSLMLLTNHNLRQYKFHLFSGNWKVLPSSIMSVSELRNYLTDLKPSDAYQSSACYCSASTVGRKIEKNKGPFRFSRNVFLYNDIVFDQDEKTRLDAYINMKKIEKWLREKYGLNYDICVQTNRGFHLHYLHENWKDILIKQTEFKSPDEKEKYYQSVFDSLRSEMETEGLKFCAVSLRTRQIFRIPFSIHNKGLICRPVKLSNKRDCLKEERIWV